MWEEIFPYEILFLRSLCTNAVFCKCAKVAYGLSIIAFSLYALYAMAISQNYLAGDPASLLFLIHFQAVILLLMPYVCQWFVNVVFSNPDFDYLISFAVRIDSRVKTKFAIIAHTNTFFLLFAATFYMFTFGEFHTDRLLALNVALFYLGPFTSAVSLAGCIIELHRILLQHFRAEINAKRKVVDGHLCNEPTQLATTRASVSDINEGDDCTDATRKSQLEMNCRPSYEETTATDLNYGDPVMGSEIKGLCDRYYQVYAIFSRSSLSYGLYMLYFLLFAILYATTTLYGIYVGEYPTSGIIGFVFVGVSVFFGLGAALTICNETGHLICRDLSSYLLSLPFSDDFSHTLSTPLGDQRHGYLDDALALLSAMEFMKLQLCYFGNMALRSSMSFAVLGSMFVAIAPVLLGSGG